MKRVRERNAFNDLICRCCISFFHCSKRFLSFALSLKTLIFTRIYIHSPNNNIFSHSMYISVLIIYYLFLLVVRSFIHSFCTFLFPPFGKLFRICATNSILIYEEMKKIFLRKLFFFIVIHFYSIVSKHVIKT